MIKVFFKIFNFKVFIYINGETGYYQNNLIDKNRKCFRRGGIDSFIIAAERYITNKN